MCILSWLVVLVTVNENASTACFQLVFSDLFSNLWLLCSVHNFVLTVSVTVSCQLVHLCCSSPVYVSVIQLLWLKRCRSHASSDVVVRIFNPYY
jgi:hypothetical protein